MGEEATGINALGLKLADDGLPLGFPQDHGVKTLGPEVLSWAEDMLAQPDGPHAGDPWRWTRTQARVLMWWYAINEEGQFLFRRGQIVIPKGGGKSPLAAGEACCRLAAPVLFDGWDSANEPVGRPHPSPVIQLTAVSQDQVSNTLDLVIPMLREGPASRELPGFDAGVTRILTRTGKILPVSASSPSREGQRLTAAVLDETHLWNESNHGTRLAATLRRNLAKMQGRSLETTNAWLPGEDSVAEQTSIYAEKLAEQGNPLQVLRYHPIGQVKSLKDPAALRHAFLEMYRDAPWVDIDRIMEEAYDPNNTPGDIRRYYLNQPVAAEDALVASYEWDAGIKDDELKNGDPVTLGFDGGKTEDATALIALRITDRFAQPLRIEEKPVGPQGEGWEVNREAFDGMVAWAFGHLNVLGFYADVALWETYVDKWAEEYRERLKVKAHTRHAIGWDMRQRIQQLTQSTERLVAAIRDGEVLHNGDPVLRRHVLNARRRPNRWGVSFGKESKESPKKVDGFAALQLADMARHDLLASGFKMRDSKVVVWL